MFFFDKQKIGLNKRKNDGTLTSYILHISLFHHKKMILKNLFNNSEKKKRIGIVFIYIYMHTIINILEINQKKKNFTERNPPYIMNRIYGIFY